MSDYRVAIPSYKRVDLLITKTLNYLGETDVDSSCVDIFVGTQKEKEYYESRLNKETYDRLIVGEVGMKQIRNFMNTYYPEGFKVFFIDDDIDMLQVKITDKEKSTLTLLDSFINQAFYICELENCPIFGIYPVNNPLFMKHKVTTDLRYINAVCYGCIINHDPELLVTVESKESIERTIKYYLKYGKVIRFNNVAPRTSYYTVSGGMQSKEFGSREERDERSVKYLLETYPELTELKKKMTKGRFYEIKLVDKR